MTVANQVEIGPELQRLLDVLPPPRGVKADKAIAGYMTALAPFPLATIHEAIDRYLAAEFPSVSLKFYPRAPELASLCRLVSLKHAEEADRVRRAERLEAERRDIAEGEKLAVKTPEQKVRAAEIYQGFLDSLDGSKARERAERLARERAETRARYGMTDEVLAGVKDRPLPKGMKPLGYALPGVPLPPEKAAPGAKPKPDDFGGMP